MKLPRPLLRIALTVPWVLAPLCAFAAEGPQPTEQAQALATCHGRYTATVEHNRLVAVENDAAAMRRDLIEALMNTFLAERAGDRTFSIALMRNRVEARSEMRNLFSAATFGQDTRRQRLADGQIRRHLSACDALILGQDVRAF